MIPARQPCPRWPRTTSMSRCWFVVALLVQGAPGGVSAQSPQPAGAVNRPAEASPRTSLAGRPSPHSRSASRAAAPGPRRSNQDPAVVRADGASRIATVAGQAGVVQAGAVVVTADCRQCGRRGCNECRGDGGRLGLHCNGRCDAGGCPAHCPVKPDQFGYYATRWRNWPGQAVRQVSHFDPATTPVIPPRSQVPTADEEAGVGPEEPPEDSPETGEGDPSVGAGGTEGTSGMADAPDDGVPEESGHQQENGDRGRSDAPALDDESAAAADEDADMSAPGRDDDSARPDADQLDRLLEPPSRGATSGPAAETNASDMPGAATPINPLRKARFPAVPASVGAGVAQNPSAPESSSPTPSRRPVEAGQWRPSRRGMPAGDIAAPLMRGVTANPGNPLR